MQRGRLKLAAAVAGVLGLGWVLGLASPTTLTGGAAWSCAVFGVLFGLGAGIRRLARVELGLGELLVLGGVAWITFTGPLIAIGVCSRVPMLAIAGLATAYAVYDVASSRRPLPRRPDGVALVLWLVLAAVLVIELLGAIGARGNPFDDHVAYTGFVKRLLERGDLIEPFSYRRVSAYGGQTSLHALVALRGSVESTDLLDRGIFQWVSVLLIVDMARLRKVQLAACALVVAFVLAIWDMTINSAATWTAFAMILGAYSFASREDGARPSWLMLTFACCAAMCTLRQNYLLPAGLFGALLLVFHLRAEGWAWRAQRKLVLACLTVAIVVVLPYMVAAWLSNRTFLYPLMLGTMNAAAPLRPTAGTASEELAFFVNTLLSSEPVRVWWILAPFMLLAVDRRALRPWRSLLIASGVGLAFMIHSFMLSDSGNMWRYAFGYTTAIVVAFALEIAPRDDDADPPLRLGLLPSLLVGLAMIAQLASSRGNVAERVRQAMRDIDDTATLGATKQADARAYRAMQDAVPTGAKVAVLLDDPYLLDYARNDVIDLDLPGFASPAPGLPAYLGGERWRSYFLSLGIRYVAFIDTAYSTYLYRRDEWIDRMFVQGELWRFMAARMVDTFDTLRELARTSPVLFHRDGFVVVDLGTTAQPVTATDEPEDMRRDAFIRHIAETEIGANAWQLVSRRDVQFRPDGVSPTAVQLDPNLHMQSVLTGNPLPPFRWLGERTRVRVHGEHRQHYRIKLWADRLRLRTLPSVRVVLDGAELGRYRAAEDGTIAIEGDASCSGWCDMYLVMSSVSEYWLPADALKGIKLQEFEWNEVP